MLARRFAAAIGLILAVVTSQLPEFVQQYRQRLGGAYDELKSIIADFDVQARSLSLDREQAVDRLEANPDELAKARGRDIEATVERAARLGRQRDAFATSGPISQYAVLLEDFDPRLARQAYRDFEPAVPVTSSGLLAGLTGLVTGWLLTHAIAWPLRRKGRNPGEADARLAPRSQPAPPPHYFR